MAKETKRRRNDAPWPKKDPKKKGYEAAPSVKKRARAQLEAARIRRRAILARTAAGRAAIDKLAEGADLSEYAHLPAVVAIARKQPLLDRRGHAKGGKKKTNIPGDAPETTPVVAPRKPPVLPKGPRNILENIPGPTKMARPPRRRNPNNKGVGRGRGTRVCTGCGKSGHYVSTCQSDAGRAWRELQDKTKRRYKKLKTVPAVPSLAEIRPSP